MTQLQASSARCKPPVAVLFTQQMVGLGTRKTGMVFWAEALARAGYESYAVTTQLSALSRLVGAARLSAVPPADRNVWRNCGERLHGFVWVPAFHPARSRVGWLDRMATAIWEFYPRLLPEAVLEVVRRADIVVIESCAALLLFDVLKKVAPPTAKFVYCASDRLSTVGMHPMLDAVLTRTAPLYDLVRIPARAMAKDFPPGSRVQYIPHGIDKAIFDKPGPSPFGNGGPNVVVAGDMLFDSDAFGVLLDSFPDVCFHTFGRMDLDQFGQRPNLVVHGEVPFEVLATYLPHADVGFAPYVDRPKAHYLVESSLKLIQYTYCRLPIVAPHFAAVGRDHVIGYTPGDDDSLRAALTAALNLDRNSVDSCGVISWDEVIERVLDKVGLPPPAPLEPALVPQRE